VHGIDRVHGMWQSGFHRSQRVSVLRLPGSAAGTQRLRRPAASAVAAVGVQAVLLEVRPSWWTFGWHLLFFWLLVPLLVALYRRHSFVMRIYTDRVSVEEDFFAKESSEFSSKIFAPSTCDRACGADWPVSATLPSLPLRPLTPPKWPAAFRNPTESKICLSRSVNSS
jgi:hypothetical protein